MALSMHATKFTFIFDGIVYPINQDQSQEVSIDDPKELQMKKGNAKKTVTGMTGGGDPIVLGFNVLGIETELMTFFENFFDGKTEEKDFELIIEGTNDGDGLLNRIKYSGCKFQKKPRQTAIAEGINSTSMMVLSTEEERIAV